MELDARRQELPKEQWVVRRHSSGSGKMRIPRPPATSRGRVLKAQSQSGLLLPASYIILRTDANSRLPVMICPRWVYTRIQPIAIQNVLDYLMAALQQPESAGRIIEIGGEDVLSYGGLMETYASVRGLKRYLLPVPFLTPRLSSYWVRLVTPFSVSLARPLIEGLRNEVIVRGNAAREIFSKVQLLDCKTAVEVALARGEAKQLANSLGRLAIPSSQQPSVSMCTEEGMILERRRRSVNASADKVYSIIAKMGGERGWLALNWASQLRGWIDQILGGVGMRRGKGGGL